MNFTKIPGLSNREIKGFPLYYKVLKKQAKSSRDLEKY
jgi:hypothetical protein